MDDWLEVRPGQAGVQNSMYLQDEEEEEEEDGEELEQGQEGRKVTVRNSCISARTCLFIICFLRYKQEVLNLRLLVVWATWGQHNKL